MPRLGGLCWIIHPAPGVEDYESMTVNGGTKNIVVDADNLPVVGTVTLT